MKPLQNLITIFAFACGLFYSLIANSQIQLLNEIGTGTINAIAYSPDGSTIAVATTRGIELLDQDLQITNFINTFNGSVKSIAFSADGQKLAAVVDQKIFQIDPTTKSLTEIPNSIGANAVKFDPNGRIFGLMLNGSITVWDGSLSITPPIKTHRFRVKTIAFSMNGDLCATGSADRKVVVRDLNELKTVKKNISGTSDVNAVVFTADGKIVSASDRFVHVWEVDRGQGIAPKIERERFKKARIRTLIDGKNFSIATDQAHGKFAISSLDGRLSIWDVTLENQINSFQISAGTFAVDLNPSGDRVLTATPFALELWDANGTKIAERKTYFSIDGFGFSADSQRVILSAHREIDGKDLGELIVWDVANRAEINRWQTIDGKIDSVRFSPDGTRVMSRIIEPNQIIRLWDVGTGEEISKLKIDQPNPPPISPMTGKTAIVEPLNFNVTVDRVEDATDLSADKIYVVHTDKDLLSLWRSPKAFHYKAARYWAVLYRQQIASAVSKNGQFSAFVDGRSVSVVLNELRKRIDLTPRHRENVRLLQFSFDNKFLATLSWDGIFRFWQIGE